MADNKKDIIDRIYSLSGAQAPRQIFADWVRCSALAPSNAVALFKTEITEEREQDYVDTVSRYDKKVDIARHFAEMSAWLAESLEEEMDDVLGEVYMKLDAGVKYGGQFFTPFHLSVLNAKVALQGGVEKYRDEPLYLNEPTCGSGGQVIAVAKVLQEAGINYQKTLRVVAQDIDWNCVYMTYVQLSLLGIRAICVQGNTLHDPYDPTRSPRRHILRTPADMGALV